MFIFNHQIFESILKTVFKGKIVLIKVKYLEKIDIRLKSDD